jgi:hypothetical protein
MKIHRIKHSRIDKEKYDRCILNARHGTIYAMSWYLDTAAPGWQLLATPGYSFVMPLPEKKKFGIPYILQPLMCQQLGIFSQEEITQSIFELFIKKIPAIYCILQLNTGNLFYHKNLTKRLNYTLDISPNYEEIKSRYHTNTRSDLKKTARNHLIIDRETDYTAIFEILKEHSLHYTGKLFAATKNIAAHAHGKGLVTARYVRDEKTSEILAGALFVLWKNRFYYLLPVSTPHGKKVRAMRFLIDRFIAEFAGKNHAIDFEGSSAPSVAQFYQSFGALPEFYPSYYKNKLGGLFQLIIKHLYTAKIHRIKQD